MTGISSPDPLKFAFAVKSSPHAGRSGSHPLDLSPQQWQSWWATPTSATQRALYIHIPFCRKRCSFCNFFENGSNSARISRYVESLSQQLYTASKTPFVKSGTFDTVYVGGGTPTDMQASEIAIIGEAIQAFPLAKNAEITLEGRLNDFTDAKFDAALASGFNRFSFGVQSFNTQVRLAAGRFDNREVLIERLQELSKHPSASIVADLIFGLPGQTMEIWLQDLQDVIQSSVHGVDLYQLIGLQGTRLSKQAEKEKAKQTQEDGSQQKQQTLVPAVDSQTRASMYAAGARLLESSGWQRLSSCHWRRDNRERSIYNSLAKSGIEILPFGAGAGGNIHGHGMMNARDLSNWHQAQTPDSVTDTLPLRVPGMVMSPNPSAALDSQFKAGLDHGELVLSEFDTEMVDHLMPLFYAWQTNGLVKISDKIMTQTLAGRFWNVNLQTGLFAYLNQNAFESCASSMST
ncbi:heme anaerobic degradation radical SAM methyltransferase ChuW/HutW [Shewanella violacea]|uniref:Coproporphyrinogen III oxidase, putative n=2 Tax=Shewanella violacea TaxID=60217 RepID=D4ZBZ1_SHEVD|nr:coproporphyrinogen III oxidase, putative [Shewanella violacea DSS12]